ncbi:MAG: glycosyltransferase family 39 protein [Gammaproteobacteria bacterium]|nr:glycosyltransferase family 39 protein [Gammaproteobacteria bacterium]
MLKRLDFLFWLLAIIVLSRLFSMILVPMIDTTEARYGEIARIMAETGDWITPWFDYGVPFWGKPPLSFWTEALSFKLFGVTEFAARLPSWLANLGMLGLIYTLTYNIAGHRQALISTLIFSTMALSFVMSGAVLTDPFLALGTTLSLVSIILALRKPKSLWCWWFFVGLSIGLLAKGPLALVLVGGPIFLWAIWQWHDLRKIPWVRGILLTALLSLPWYIAAELKSPGFINYFIVGEHFLRFVDSGWSGDLYGSAHDQPFGTIWLYWIWASLPWGPIAIILLIWRCIATRKCNPLIKQKLSDEQRLLLLFALFPSLFFTFSGNILWTYQLPALAPLAILIAMLLAKSNTTTMPAKSGLITAVAFVPFVVMFIGFYAHFYPDKLKTEKTLIAYYNEHKINDTQPLIYIEKAPFSARFYSGGRVKTMELDEVKLLIKNGAESVYFVAVANGNRDEIISSLPGQVKVELTNRRFTLLQINRVAQTEMERNIVL